MGSNQNTKLPCSRPSEPASTWSLLWWLVLCLEPGSGILMNACPPAKWLRVMVEAVRQVSVDE